MRQVLADIVAREGAGILRQPRRCKAFLRDRCPSAVEEIRVLWLTLAAGLGRRLGDTPDGERTPAMLASIVTQFAARCALDRGSVAWAVGACAAVLGYDSAALAAASATDPPPPVQEEPSTVPARPEAPPPVSPPAPSPVSDPSSRSWMVAAVAAVLLLLAGIVYYGVAWTPPRQVVPLTPVSGQGSSPARTGGDATGAAPDVSGSPELPPEVPPVSAPAKRPATQPAESPAGDAAPATETPVSAPPAAAHPTATFKPRDPALPPAELEPPRTETPQEPPPVPPPATPEARPKSRLVPTPGTRDQARADLPVSQPKKKIEAGAEPASVPEMAAPADALAKDGVIVWSGTLEGANEKVDRVLEIRGSTASFGDLRGALPGRPVTISVQPKDIGIAEAPGPQNGWRKIVLRSLTRRQTVVTITWRIIE